MRSAQLPIRSLTAPTWSNAELGVADDVGVQEKKGKKRKAAAAPAELSKNSRRFIMYPHCNDFH